MGEFISGFAPAQGSKTLQARIKCNVYNFRCNYFLIVAIVDAVCLFFLRGLYSILAQLLCIFAILCLNDTFAASVRCGPCTDLQNLGVCSLLAVSAHPELLACMSLLC